MMYFLWNDGAVAKYPQKRKREDPTPCITQPSVSIAVPLAGPCACGGVLYRFSNTNGISAILFSKRWFGYIAPYCRLVAHHEAEMKYSRSMRILHWVMAVIIIGLIALGITIMQLPDNDPLGDVLLRWHKSFGMLVLLLVGVRVLIRLRSVIPALPQGISRLEARAAHAVHMVMYALMLLVPLTGYSMSSVFTQSDGVFFFGTFLPELLPKNDAWFPVFEEAHHVLAFTLLGLLVLHVGGALKHRFLDRGREQDVLSRMS